MPPEDRPADDVLADRIEMAIYDVLHAIDIRWPDYDRARHVLREFAAAIIDEAVRKAIAP